MAKAALNMQTKSLAMDLRGYNIALVAVHPGRVPTRMSGGNGQTDMKESSDGMMKILRELTLENSGQFKDWSGEDRSW